MVRLMVTFAMLLLLLPCFANKPLNEIEALTTFAKLYGYVKYFHPSDEAAQLDWDAFAIHGVKQVRKAKDQDDLVRILNELFLPIAPAIHISTSSVSADNLFKALHFGIHDSTYWQHEGNGYFSAANYYKSKRINRKDTIVPNRGYYNAYIKLSRANLQGKKVKINGRVKTSITSASSFAKVWIRYKTPQRGNEYVGENRLFTNEDWEGFEISGHIPDSVDDIRIELGLFGRGSMLLDYINIAVWNSNRWENVHKEDFTDYHIDSLSGYTGRHSEYQDQALYTKSITSEANNSVLEIKSISMPYKGENRLYNNTPRSLFYSGQICAGINVFIPYILPTDSLNTYPKASNKKFSKLSEELKAYRYDHTFLDINARQGNIINFWNEFKYFYPYQKYLDLDWDKELEFSLLETTNNKNSADFLFTIRKFMSKLQDGHVQVYKAGYQESVYSPPFELEYIEDKLVVTHVYEDNINVQEGDILLKADGQRSDDIFAKKCEAFGASTDENTYRRTAWNLLNGASNEILNLELLRNNRPFETKVKRSISFRTVFRLNTANNKDKKFEFLNDSVAYINLTQLSYEEFKTKIDSLQACKAIIFDLRGYPKMDGFINHLLPQNDTSMHWLKIPLRMTAEGDFDGFVEEGWGKKKDSIELNTNNFFLVNTGAISYAESVLGFIENYKLGTLVGSPSAGINGDINMMNLPGGYLYVYTGTEVVKHDGSRHFGVGFEPDVPVKPTIKGIQEGRDEVLERALELANGQYQ